MAWADLKSVNIKDFDAVVFNVTSLDDKTIARLPRYGFFDHVRKELSILLRSGGRIIALTPERRTIKNGDSSRTNWEWCPIDIGTRSEAGDTIEIQNSSFDRYLANLKRWTFYFVVPPTALTGELIEVFGPPALITYKFPADAHAINRYGMMLAGEVTVRLTKRDGVDHDFGNITILPYIADLDQKEAMNLLLEELIGKPQRTLPPDWVAGIAMPLVDAINADIAKKNGAIESLLREIAASEQKRAEIEKWKQLVYATGRELEQIFEEAVTKLGAKTKPASAEEEFIFEFKKNASVVECKGVGKSISLDHVRQTDSHVLKFIEATKREAKGVLFGNAWRNFPLNKRGKAETLIFPDNVIEHASKRGIALVGATDFLKVFCQFLKNEVSGEAILDAMTTQSGIVDFRGVK